MTPCGILLIWRCRRMAPALSGLLQQDLQEARERQIPDLSGSPAASIGREASQLGCFSSCRWVAFTGQWDSVK